MRKATLKVDSFVYSWAWFGDSPSPEKYSVQAKESMLLWACLKQLRNNFGKVSLALALTCS